jgi:RNA polymerase sigma-70 factor (ECF subfamily)
VDDAEFEALYRREYPGLVGQLTVLCRDAAEAADCVQEAFVKAWQNRRDLDRDRSPGGWVRTAAVRVAVSRARRRSTGLAAVRRWRWACTTCSICPSPTWPGFWACPRGR